METNPTPLPVTTTITNNNTDVTNNINHTNHQQQQPFERHFWTPIQRVHQINEYWATASCPTLPAQLIPATMPLQHNINNDSSVTGHDHPSQGQANFGSMSYWQSFVDEFFEMDANTATAPVNSPSDIGLLSVH